MQAKEAAKIYAEAFSGDKDLLDDAQTTCACGWDGTGTGTRGRVVKSDRCPQCGESLS